jgi:hypothetical protein
LRDPNAAEQRRWGRESTLPRVSPLFSPVTTMRSMCKLSSGLALGLCLFMLTGCGAGGQPVNGTVIFPPNVTLHSDDSIAIVFQPEDSSGKAGNGRVSPDDKTFIAKGPNGGGIPPGKYTVSLTITPYTGHPDYKKRAKMIEDFNKQYSITPTRLAYEVTSDSPQSITIDLGRGLVTKN